MEKILVTGCSGFIGFHLCKKLIYNGYEVFGVDNMNNYYDVILKEARLNKLVKNKNFTFLKADIENEMLIKKVFSSFRPDKVVNLAAQAGVRYSLENPKEYIRSNIVGFMNILECCRKFKIEGLIYASSSSVYGGNKKTPFSVEDAVEKPQSIYAASKKANELMAYSYSHLYGLNTTGLRFFTVYGPWGRPDMAMYIFTKKILNSESIPVFNYGKMKRDFTYIDDIIDGLNSSLEKNYKCEIFNLGRNRTEDIFEMIRLIETSLGRKAKIKLMDMQPGDVKETFADISYSKLKLSYNPTTSIHEGIPKFIRWYKDYNLKDN